MIAVKQKDTNLALNLQILTKASDLNADFIVSCVAANDNMAKTGERLMAMNRIEGSSHNLALKARADQEREEAYEIEEDEEMTSTSDIATDFAFFAKKYKTKFPMSFNDKKKRTCYNCDEDSHFANECPYEKRVDKPNVTPNTRFAGASLECAALCCRRPVVAVVQDRENCRQEHHRYCPRCPPHRPDHLAAVVNHPETPRSIAPEPSPCRVCATDNGSQVEQVVPCAACDDDPSKAIKLMGIGHIRPTEVHTDDQDDGIEVSSSAQVEPSSTQAEPSSAAQDLSSTQDEPRIPKNKKKALNPLSKTMLLSKKHPQPMVKIKLSLMIEY
ncbi:hypothetical protein QYE76_071817 [Lolium multiflorum]|uniref:CCHC-type domain-containing protein n=1 Tax=Lolium multiflorum TaxID=4521 RepID=A0AAD8SMT5_LOLMU|nr:hypothetical protein QYE76_071817 [Lolium multiflorum]